MRNGTAKENARAFMARGAVGIATLGLLALPVATAQATQGTFPESPSAPKVTWVKNATSEHEVKVEWEPVPGANHYLCNGITLGNVVSCTLTTEPDTIVAFHIQACNDSACSAVETVRTATSPVAPSKVHVRKVVQPVAGGGRCALLRWDDTTEVDHYGLEMRRNGVVAGGRIVKSSRTTVCGLDPKGRFDFTVTPINRLESLNGAPTGSTVLFGKPSSKSRTVKAVPTTKPGRTSITAESAYESVGDVKVTGSIAEAKPADATFIRFKFPDRINYVDVRSGKVGTFAGLQYNQDYTIYAAFCNDDGCSEYGNPSPKIRSASSPQLWNLTSATTGQATYSTYGMRGNGGYSYRIKYCNRTKTSGCDPNTDPDGTTGWITDRNENTVNFNQLKSGNKYAFMYVQSVETDGSNPKTYSTPKVVTVK